MKDPHVLFADYAAQEGLKMTPQRRHILDVFLLQEGHVTSEELYERVKKSYKTIGQATVYRTLKLLSGSGVAKEVDFGDGVTRYERHLDEGHHDHLICERCGANVEVLDETIEKLQEEVAARHGFTLTRHKMYLYGVCPACRGGR
ncbi:Ferric uptake regulation protein [Fundidesulfovibrio magnetotacticus]|uniref:Ferric uptake regulation protein n=1 Tax=Fundidesulfovibrio magnetotacticus TaxID=2730080 RepID=A0A6V8LUK0_9BACT|nr:Fur family transcriptional regulator [Fundidesulfovibrio magnetotacticus]GFK93789.1 Ferric uptake regulation protein [Fundidesulfovibrio magnetotacticus]